MLFGARWKVRLRESVPMGEGKRAGVIPRVAGERDDSRCPRGLWYYRFCFGDGSLAFCGVSRSSFGCVSVSVLVCVQTVCLHVHCARECKTFTWRQKMLRLTRASPVPFMCKLFVGEEYMSA